MSDISFFTGMMDASGVCRGLQVCEYLGAKFNPTSGYENDICIFVKKRPPDSFPKHSYYDVVDHPRAGTWLLEHPNMKVIATSVLQKEYLSKVLGRKDIILIPHHHCNYERVRRNDRPVKNVGFIGNLKTFQYDLYELCNRLSKSGLNLIFRYKYSNRQDVVNFYNKIDIQIIWRFNIRHNYHNPLKLSNAGSFGIPTISYPEPNFVTEWNDYFIPVLTIDKLFQKIEWLRDEKNYKQISDKVIEKAEEYHIEKISKLYLELK